MHNRFSVSILLVIATVVWGTFLLILGVELTWDYAKPYSLTLGVLTSSLWVFDKYLWRIWPFTIFCKRPDLRGTWRATLQSSYVNPETKVRIQASEAYVVIRQSFSSISIRLMTDQSESFLVVGNIDTQNDGTSYLHGVYQSEPSILLRSGISEIHYGSFRYKILGNPPTELNGHYWTDRNTNGSIRLFGKNKELFDSFLQAKNSNAALIFHQ